MNCSPFLLADPVVFPFWLCSPCRKLQCVSLQQYKWISYCSFVPCYVNVDLLEVTAVKAYFLMTLRKLEGFILLLLQRPRSSVFCKINLRAPNNFQVQFSKGETICVWVDQLKSVSISKSPRRWTAGKATLPFQLGSFWLFAEGWLLLFCVFTCCYYL